MSEGAAETRVDSGRAYLDVSALAKGLGLRAARGGVVTLASQFLRQVIHLGFTMVMARILLPSDYGLVAMVTAVTGFMSVFKDMGLSMATVQRQEISADQVSALFWVNASLGLALTLITAGLAPLLARFYKEPRLLWITLALAVGFLSSGFAVQHQALLQRQMRFATLALVDIATLLLECAVGIAAALAGWGYWALVLTSLSASLARTGGLWIACHWRPGRPVLHGSGLRAMLTFGGRLSVSNILTYLARNLDNVLIGRFWGQQQLGLYAKAYSLLLLPISMINAPIAAVAVPALSRLQNDPEAYKRLFLKAISLVAFVTMPGAAFLIGMSYDLIRVILGEKWVGASPMFLALGISAPVQAIWNAQGWLYVSMGRTDRLLKWSLVSSGLIVLSFVIGLPQGAKGVALSYSCAVLLIILPSFRYAFEPTAIRVLDLLGAVAEPLGASLISLALGVLLLRYLPCSNSLARLMIGFLTQAIAYISISALLPRGRAHLGEGRRLLLSYLQSQSRHNIESGQEQLGQTASQSDTNRGEGGL